MIRLSSRFPGIEIPTDNPFQNDKLGYFQYASILKGMVDMYRGMGSVIAINGKWGTGKTTFVQMWKASLPKDEYSTIYFNAWETDYFTDPLIAMLGELKEISQDSDKFKTVVASLGKIAIAAGGAALKGIIKKTTGIDSDVVKDSVDEVKTAIQDSLEDYKDQKQSLTEFKSRLSEFVASQDNKAVVFIIDELDRCNPHYAVRVLEIVKHFFDVPNICFVIAIDKSQLECSIKGFYGSNEIDAENYLRRIIDIEFRMPEPYIEGFTNLLFDAYNFRAVFDQLREMNNNTESEFLLFATSLGNLYQLDYRTYDKIMAHTRLVFAQRKTEAILIEVAFLLCFLRVTDRDFYNNISAHTFNVQSLLLEFEKRIQKIILSKQGPGYINHIASIVTQAIALLLLLYNRMNGSEEEIVFNGLQVDAELQLSCSVINKAALKNALKQYDRYTNKNYGLRRLLDSVNLLEQFE